MQMKTDEKYQETDKNVSEEEIHTNNVSNKSIV